MRVPSLVAAVAVLFGVVSVVEAQGAPAACNLAHASGVQQRQLMSGGRERS